MDSSANCICKTTAFLTLILFFSWLSVLFKEYSMAVFTRPSETRLLSFHFFPLKILIQRSTFTPIYVSDIFHESLAWTSLFLCFYETIWRDSKLCCPLYRLPAHNSYGIHLKGHYDHKENKISESERKKVNTFW